MNGLDPNHRLANAGETQFALTLPTGSPQICFSGGIFVFGITSRLISDSTRWHSQRRL